MFCPASNDTFLSITEKTKLLAQKCTNQIQVIAAGGQQNQQTSNSQSQQSHRHGGGMGYNSKGHCDGSPVKASFNCLGGLCLGPVASASSSSGKGTIQRTTKWYVKPTWRLWGEEKEKDAIHTVYLKKVRYHRPTPSAANRDSDDEISHLEWETVRVRFIKAATLPRLVDALATDDGELESTFINVFMATYRTFARANQVLDLLLKRYERLRLEKLQSEQVVKAHQNSLVSALHVWLDGYPEDWDVTNLENLIVFTARMLPNSEVHLKAVTRLERIESRMTMRELTPPSWGSSPDDLDMLDQMGGMCLNPAFRIPQLHILNSYRFPHISVKHFAEQLTRMDMELFKRLIPHQCLGAVWSGKDKHEAPTVLATVNQFNAVSFRVISSVLIEPRLKPQDRALIIATWVDIAQELRILKNFSSLKAIISGLQSNAVYRLSKMWAAMSKDKLELFKELARIFSEENNAWAQREVLMREGTAKIADTVGENDRHLQKVFQKQNHLTSHGTIPYMGTFLTDLTMIHAAIPDTIGQDRLINFDKRRKEFEVLAQIKLLQGAANAYQLPEDPMFDRWFASLLVLDEKESHNLSCLLEPSNEPTRSGKSPAQHGHKKSDSITSNSSSGAGSHFYCDINNSSLSSRNNSLDRDATPPNASMLSTASSASSLSLESSSTSTSGNLLRANGHSTPINPKGPVINGQLVQKSSQKNSCPDFYIIRVTYETDHVELDGIVLYKSIMLGNNERTPQVIRNAMMKLGLEANPDDYTLSQVLPDRELRLPASANVYYAVNTQHNLNFILRPKRASANGDTEELYSKRKDIST